MTKPNNSQEMQRFNRGEYDSAGDNWPKQIWSDDDYWRWLEEKEMRKVKENRGE